VSSPLSHTSHKLQPLDVGVFASLKTAYRDRVERLYRGGVTIVGKEHFTSLYSPAREEAFKKRNIMARWAGSGLYLRLSMPEDLLALLACGAFPKHYHSQADMMK
jgi:hypothetical protein